MVFIEDGKIICKYKDFINYASSYQEQKTNWEISIMAIGLKIIDPQEIFKNLFDLIVVFLETIRIVYDMVS